MCRLILAHGSFDPARIVAAAVEMSCGVTANHDNATKVHAHGWGAVWRDPATGALQVHRDTRPLADSVADSPVGGAPTDFLAIHARNATLPAQQGIRFTHPLKRPGDDWYFMHNGYLPTVHQLLGRPGSVFDSAEYFDYVIEPGTLALDEKTTLAKLRAIPPGGMSGNAIAVHPRHAHLIHWSPPDTRTPRFFDMQRLSLPGAQVVASELLPSLAPPGRWRPVPPDTVMTFPFGPERISSCPLPGDASSTTSAAPAAPLLTDRAC